MGCISSKPSGDEQPNDDVINLDHDLAVATDDGRNGDASELQTEPQSPKEDNMLMTDANTNEKILTSGRSKSFHTVEEYDELLRTINKKDDDDDDDDVEGVKVIENNLDKPVNDIEFQTVPSLRQWLDSPHEDSGNADASTDYQTTKFDFGSYDDKQQKEESIVELVAAFDEYMQQLQIEEETILKQIHNKEWA